MITRIDTQERIIDATEGRNVLERRVFAQLSSGPTPSVLNNEYFSCSGSVITITNFTKGQDGQKLHIFGDGKTSIANNEFIHTSSGSTELLANNVFYVFVQHNDKWYSQISSGSTPGSSDSGINITELVNQQIVIYNQPNNRLVSLTPSVAGQVIVSDGTNPNWDFVTLITGVGVITVGTWTANVISTTYTQAQVISVAGTTDRISVGGTSTAPIIDISTNYVGQTSITTLGTITTGSFPWANLSGVPSTFPPTNHDLVSSTHTASGLTTGYFLKSLSATTFGFAAHGLSYGDVGAAAASHTHAASQITVGTFGGSGSAVFPDQVHASSLFAKQASPTQLWLGYDDSNYFSISISAAGLASFQTVGGGSEGPGCKFLESIDVAFGKVYKVNTVQVLGAQGAAVADATDAASVITQLNLLLARARTHGFIAT
jgi:hypothetical protein